jgi:alkylation response protein AidB-like acyl-CoA dehydrogenase
LGIDLGHSQVEACNVVNPDDAFRAEARAWLAEHAPAMRERQANAGDEHERFDAFRAWQRELFDGGWAGLTWPREFGGRGEPAPHASVFAEEQARFGVWTGFVGSTVGMVGPVLMRHGNASQQARFLRPLLRADETWCQLFSEPGAGSDLANLSTRADADGDSFLVSGQKVWTSNAHLCDFAILLARTDPDQPKHRGITFFLLDLRTPGIDIRPLRQITGAAHFNEVFLDNVRVPAEHVVGEVNGGWGPARTVLANEASVIGAGTAGGTADALVDLAQTLGCADDPLVRQRLAVAITDDRVLAYLKARIQAAVRAGRAPDIDGSLLKIRWSEARRDRAALGVALIGARGALVEHWPVQLLEYFSGTIGGGTNEIHRTMLGERVLGLPAEPRLDRDVSYRKLESRNG